MRKLALGMAAAIAILMGQSSAQGAVALALDLLVDVSGSVDATEYLLQKTGYVNAFDSATIQAAIAGQTGGVAVRYIEWGGAGQQSINVNWTLLTDQASCEAFADAIAASARAFTGTGTLTAPGSAINYAVSVGLTGGTMDPAVGAARWVIDVSGDGAENTGADTSDARDAALAGPVDAINGLAIGDATLAAWYAANIQGGTGSFTESVDSFADFGAAVDRKIIREITGVPEPASLMVWSLLGAAAIGAVVRRNRRAA